MSNCSSPVSRPRPVLDKDVHISSLEKQVQRLETEVLSLSKMVLEKQAAPAPVPVPAASKVTHLSGLDPEIRMSAFAVMAMSLDLTRVPILMRFGFFRRRHIRRLANALMAHGLIDVEWYRATYPEVAESEHEPAVHFVIHGMPAGHIPHPAFSA